jgi:hypothetical protein
VLGEQLHTRSEQAGCWRGWGFWWGIWWGWAGRLGGATWWEGGGGGGSVGGLSGGLGPWWSAMHSGLVIAGKAGKERHNEENIEDRQ